MDLAHLRYVHGYDNVDPVQEVSVDGPSLETSFDFTESSKDRRNGEPLV